MGNPSGALTPSELESRRKNSQKSTGPRTAAGKRRAALNALKYGRFTGPHTAEQSMVLLGEDPWEFQRFLAGLIIARQPADAVEQMLVEEIAVLAWKKKRLNRAQEGLQVHSLEVLELDRHRRALEVGRETADISQAEVLKSGLRRAPKSPAKFGEILSHLETLTGLVGRQDFSQDIDSVITILYGEAPTLRGAEIANIYRQLREQGVETEESRALAAGLKVAIEEETRDVVEEYTLYLQEHVHVSPALRSSLLAPVHPQWTALIRHEYTLDRLIERKLKLLTQIQRARKIQERAAQAAEERAEKEKKNSFLKNEPGDFVENKASSQKTNRKNGKTNRKTKRAMLLKVKDDSKNTPKTNRKTKRAMSLKIKDGQKTNRKALNNLLKEVLGGP